MNKAIYRQAKRNGCSDKMAELLASRRCPALQTDKTWFNQFNHLGDELPTGYLDGVVEDARALGYQPSLGDVYVPGLADRRGDPKAFVSRATGARKKIKDYMNRIERGPDKDPYEGSPRLADDIVADLVQQRVEADPGLLQRRDIREVKEEVVETHGPRK